MEDDAREAQKFLERDDRNVLAKQIDTDCSIPIHYADIGDVADASDVAASAAAAADAAAAASDAADAVVVVVVVVDDTYSLSVDY